MTSDFTTQLTAGLLVLTLVTVIATSIVLALLAARFSKKQRRLNGSDAPESSEPEALSQWQPSAFNRPSRWLAIRSSNVPAVQAALRLHNATPCSWYDGIHQLAEHLFISPPIRGWILVVGQGLPDPATDVDVFYRWLIRLSREMGQVQFFIADRTLDHHAWARIEDGKVRRAYAWCGKTLWNQGAETLAEIQVGLKCFDYGEAPDPIELSPDDSHLTNVEKVELLAASWSLDPSSITDNMLKGRKGIVGDLVHSRKH